MDVPASPESDTLLLPLRKCRESLCGDAFVTALSAIQVTNGETESHRWKRHVPRVTGCRILSCDRSLSPFCESPWRKGNWTPTSVTLSLFQEAWGPGQPLFQEPLLPAPALSCQPAGPFPQPRTSASSCL